MHEPSPDAIRQRRRRWRLRVGATHVRLDVPAAVIERLMDLGYLREENAETPEEIAAALLEAFKYCHGVTQESDGTW